MNGDAPPETGRASRGPEATPSSPEDSSRTAPLNLSKKPEARAATHSPVYKDYAELQDMPLNLSVKDPCNVLTRRPSVHSPPQEAEPATTAAHNTETGSSQDGPDPTPTNQTGLDATEGPSTAPTMKAQDTRAVDSSDEQKQTAAVALCQLAAYSPGNIRVGDGEPTAPESPGQQDAPTLGTTESPEAQCDLRPRGQKRTSPREAGKSQQGTKKTKQSDTARVFTLRKRTRVS